MISILLDFEIKFKMVKFESMIYKDVDSSNFTISIVDIKSVNRYQELRIHHNM